MGTSPAGILAANGGVNVTGSGTIAGGKLISSASGGLAINISASQSLTVASVVADPTGGSTSLVKGGNGTLVLSGTNTYTGGTTIQSGTLQLVGTGALGNGGVTLGSGGILDLGGNNLAVSSLVSSTGSTVTDNSASSGTTTLTLASGSFNPSVFAGTICDGPHRVLAMVVSRSETFSGSGTYTGGTTVTSGGSMMIGNPYALPQLGALTINGGGVTLQSSLGRAVLLGSLVFGSTGSGNNELLFTPDINAAPIEHGLLSEAVPPVASPAVPFPTSLGIDSVVSDTSFNDGAAGGPQCLLGRPRAGHGGAIVRRACCVWVCSQSVADSSAVGGLSKKRVPQWQYGYGLGSGR